jgi:hypothetical protein
MSRYRPAAPWGGARDRSFAGGLNDSAPPMRLSLWLSGVRNPRFLLLPLTRVSERARLVGCVFPLHRVSSSI